jgi:hypothetical protein
MTPAERAAYNRRYRARTKLPLPGPLHQSRYAPDHGAAHARWLCWAVRKAVPEAFWRELVGMVPEDHQTGLQGR